MVINDGALFVVCEGEKTENYFLHDLYGLLKKEKRCAISHPDIFPAPKRDSDIPQIESSRARGGRKMNDANGDVKPEPQLSGAPPLNWVNLAMDGLKSHSEAWVVFDHDDHYARAEAFKIVADARKDGKNINIAFSSRSFEYYMLQHFEYRYHPFDNTECHGAGHKYLNCCHPDPDKTPLDGACDGDLTTGGNCCINGYARRHGYWIESKTEGVIDCLPSLWRGIANAYRVKWRSIANDRQTAVYERNPYLDTYRIVLRFMGIKSLEVGYPIHLHDKTGVIAITLHDGLLMIHNGTDRTLIISSDNTRFYQPEVAPDGQPKTPLALNITGGLGRIVLGVNDSCEYNLCDNLSQDSILLLKIRNTTIFVANPEAMKDDFNDEDRARFDLSTLQ